MARPIGFRIANPDTIAPIRALNSLTEKHAAALAGLAWTWSLDGHEGYDGDLTILPTSLQDTGSAFVISRKAALFHRAASVGDQYRQIGAFASLGDLMHAVDAEQPPELDSDGSA